MGVQKVIITGKVIRKPEMKFTGSGTPFTKVTVPTYNPKGQDTFWDIVIWGKSAERLATQIQKGTIIQAEGKFGVDNETGEASTWVDSDGNTRVNMSVHCWNVDLIDNWKKATATDSEPEGNDPF